MLCGREPADSDRFPISHRHLCPILSRGHGFSTQVAVGIDEDLKHESWILCDNLGSIHKVQLTRFVGSLVHSKIEELDQALKMALALD